MASVRAFLSKQAAGLEPATSSLGSSPEEVSEGDEGT